MGEAGHVAAGMGKARNEALRNRLARQPTKTIGIVPVFRRIAVAAGLATAAALLTTPCLVSKASRHA